MTSSTPFSQPCPRLAAAGLLAASLLLGGIAPAHAVPMLWLVPSTTSVTPNQAFTVGVMASDITDLFGYQFSVSFDANLFSVTGVGAGSFLSAAGPTFYSPGAVDNAAGNVSFVFETLLSAVAGVNGSGLLGTIAFGTLPTAAGIGSIGLYDVGAVNSSLDAIALSPVTPALVSAVPEPATWAMMALGLAGVFAMKRRRPSEARRP